MRESNTASYCEDSLFDRRIGVRDVEVERSSGPAEEPGIAKRLGSGDEHQELRWGRQLGEAPLVALLDLSARPLRIEYSESAAEPAFVPGSWELEEREWVSMTLGEDLIADRRVDRAADVPEE